MRPRGVDTTLGREGLIAEGGVMGDGPAEKKRRFVTDGFARRDGFTTFGTAVALLTACALAFACAWTVRNQSRAAGVQATADAAALAAQNEVAEFVIAVRMADSALLSMSLTGLSLVGVGTACCCAPPTAASGKALIGTGKRILEKRDEMARTAKELLSAAQDALPAAAQVHAQAVMQENADSLGARAVGLVELVPQTGEPLEVGESSAAGAADAALDASEGIAAAAQESEQARSDAQAALEKGFDHDCGNAPGYCMYERADTVAGLPPSENPLYHSVNAWSFKVALERAQAYYPHRAATEAPADGSVEEQARSALRKRFYEFAADEVVKGRAADDGASVPDIRFPLLPKNTAEMKETELYTEAVYPAAGGCLHAWDGCPGAASGIEGRGSLAQQDAGAYGVCATCGFDAASLGKVAAASSAIENGFEYHYRKVAEAAREYVEAMERALPAESSAKDAVDGVFDRIRDAIGDLGGCRIEAYPPGRYGALAALSLSVEESAPTPFLSEASDEGAYAAVSASVLGEDAEEDVLSSLLDGVADEIGPPLSDAGPAILSLWSSLVKAYSTGTEGLCSGVEDLLDSMPIVGSTGLGSWAREALVGMLEAAGIEPANTEAAKPFVANTEHVAPLGDGPVATAVASLKGAPRKGSASVFDAAGVGGP